MKADAPPLADLLDAAAGGDEAAFKEIYGLSSAKLFGIVLRIVRRRAAAEEILQEVYLKIWDNAATYRPDKGSPMTWMIAIARNRALDWQRRDRVRGGDLPIDEAPGRETWSDPEPDPLDWAMARQDAQALHDCLERLEEEPRTCLVLAYCEGYTHEELSERLARPLGTVKSWIRRGQARLKDCLMG
ncbi:MAG: sigma-70 family RNA polymerase sigma factor [Kiloniellales bacterium]|nr:sigma-70 family RNA polymerase sigma factor [Kiloniellales bacterium]